MPKSAFKLNLSEVFPRLSSPPIVEAVIHWRARAQKSLAPDVLRESLKEKLPQYSTVEPLQQLELMAMLSAQETAPVVQHKQGWNGFRLAAESRRDLVQVTRDGVAFSRVKDYDDWDNFVAAAMVAWQSYVEIAEPLEIQRLGVRFINQLPTAQPETLDTLLNDPPSCPANLPLKEFVYQSTFDVPDHPLGIRLTKVMQPTLPDLPQSSGLFLDCDVFTTRPIDLKKSAINDALTKMRWLKNKVFFTLLTGQAIQSLV